MKSTLDRRHAFLAPLVLLTVLISVTAPANPALMDVRQEGDRQVVLKLDELTDYRIFHLREPARLFVYLYRSRIEAERLDITGTGDYIRYIKVHPFEGNYGTVRVEIGIAPELQYKDWTHENKIFIWVGKPSETPPAPPPKPDLPETKPPPPPMEPAPLPHTPEGESVDDDNTEAGDETCVPQARINFYPEPTEVHGSEYNLYTRYLARPSSTARASVLLDTVVTAGTVATRVMINTNGPARAFDDFILIEPNRLVIDIFDVKADFLKKELAIGSNTLGTVRWADHKDRVRIVMDLTAAEGVPPYYTARRLASGVEVVLYSTHTVEDMAESGFVSYTVGADESLGDIALKNYGDHRAWRRIVSFNRDKFADAKGVLDSEGTIYPAEGMVLRIPKR